jgi:hypothetical protein
MKKTGGTGIKKDYKKDKGKVESEKSKAIPSETTASNTVTDPIFTPNPNAAVYYQRTKVFHEEFKLIGVVIDREEVVKQLENIVREVKEGRKDCGDDVILETFRLFNVVRRLTFKVIKAISIWQDSFTKQLRPIVFQGDYIIEKLIKYIDFINSSKLKKIFNFQFYRGNVLLLPYPSLKEEDPIKVPPALGKEIKDFAFPSEDEIISAYTVLYNTLPEDIYREKVVSIEKWLMEPWVPRIWISTNNGDQPYFQSNGRPNKPKPTDALEGAAQETPTKDQNKTGSLSKSNPKSLLKGAKGTNSMKLSPLKASGTSPGASRKSMKSKSGENNDDSNNIAPLSPQQRKRRNQLVKQQTQDISALTDLAQVEAQQAEEEARKLAALEAEKEEEQQNRIRQAQMREIDTYYDSLQSQFLSTRKRPESPEIMATNSMTDIPAVPINPLTPHAVTRSVPINFFATLHSENSIVEDADDLVEELLKGESDKKSDKKEKQKKKDKKSAPSSKPDTAKSKSNVDSTGGADIASVGSSQAPSIDTASFDGGTGNNSLDASEEHSFVDSVTGEGSFADEGNSDEDSITEGAGRKLTKGVSRKFSDFTDSDILSPDRSRKIQEVKPKKINYNALSKLLKPDNSQPTVSVYGRPIDTKKKLSDLRVSTKFVRTWYKVENQIT